MALSDITGKVKSARPVVPQIYAYTTPEIARHNGWTKIGYTEQDVETRIRQQTHTADVRYELHWHGNAVYEGGGAFKDKDFHGYLRKLGIANEPDTEWFQVEPAPAKGHFNDYRENRGVLDTPTAMEYQLRDEQARAVEQTASYAQCHERGEFLWNAKPRFGKTLTAYDFCMRVGATKVLIVTNRPAIANSWYDDYVRFLGRESGLNFVSSVDALKGRPYCMTRQEYLDRDRSKCPRGFIEFVSLQNLKGSVYFGGQFEKLSEVAKLEWDVLIIDEAHEGVDTLKTDVAFDHIERKFTLHLSGTPFKAIANEKFPEDAIFNWTYADEQRVKAEWPEDSETANPYADLPRLNMFTYRMSDIVARQVQRGVDIDGETVEYAFDLNEFFATDQNGRFVHNDDVDRFLDALTTQRKFPFSTPELRDELRHTFWMLNRVDSAKALAKKLQKHSVFKEYEIVLAAGDGKLDDEDENTRAFDKVREAIAANDRTITLSVGQLTTGVTIPEWTAVLMLSNMKSPSLYMQAAFRAQNPCLFSRGGGFLRKENAYVFDFDPARTLTIFEEFANDLYSDTASGGGTLDDRKRRIRTLLNFYPVLGEDENGEMIELDAERVLSIPRKIRSQEVVRRGFMSDFLFQNIGNVFHAPAEVIEVLQKFEPYKAPNEDLGIRRDTADELDLNDEGEVEVPEDMIIGESTELFGDKVYGIEEELDDVIDAISLGDVETDEDRVLDELAKAFGDSIAKPLVDAARQRYEKEDLKPAQQKKIERRIRADVDIKVNREKGSFKINRNIIEKERKTALAAAETQKEADEINASSDAKLEAALDELRENLRGIRGELVKEAGKTIVREVETAKRESKKQTLESNVRDHLRGFSRTIPSFLMAYGDESTTLSVFDTTVPPDVFYEVTSITVDEFRFLRDGGDFTNRETGEVEHFDGHLFDPVVFDDSVAEFIRLRGELANYFDESLEEDIFDYVPPQKTNQIFTPRKVVVQMVDMFEGENPGCFDDPEHTFADLYMKSGLYVAEIVKRLYNSERMRELFPDDRARLDHILENQVFGIAPTEIIYQIATHFILGYNGEVGDIERSNFVCVDSAELAKEGKLAEFVERTWGDKLQDDSGCEGTETKTFVQTNPVAESRNETTAANVAPDGDWILQKIKDAGLEYVDKRSSGGNLWVIGGASLQGFVSEMAVRGAKFTFVPKGGKVTKHRPAWYIAASMTERLLGNKQRDQKG
jgi:superfamily II DNA or RNA helicase